MPRLKQEYHPLPEHLKENPARQLERDFNKALREVRPKEFGKTVGASILDAWKPDDRVLEKLGLKEEVAQEAVENILRGSRHGNVYAWLEQKKRKIMQDLYEQRQS